MEKPHQRSLCVNFNLKFETANCSEDAHSLFTRITEHCTRVKKNPYSYERMKDSFLASQAT